MWPQRYQQMRVAPNRHQGEKALLVRPAAQSGVVGGGVVVSVWVRLSHTALLSRSPLAGTVKGHWQQPPSLKGHILAKRENNWSQLSWMDVNMRAIAVRAVESKLPKEFVSKCLPSFSQQEQGRANIGAFSFHAAQPVLTSAETCRRNTFKVTNCIKEISPWLDITLQKDTPGT